MNDLEQARQRARECRALLEDASGILLSRVEAYLRDEHGVWPHPTNQRHLRGSIAEVCPAECLLYYDRRLDADLAEKLLAFAHELGHLERHHRLTSHVSKVDPVLGSAYANAGASSLARYSPHAQEEAEANAFASEFLCPSDEVFARWRADPEATSDSLASELGIPARVVRAQLAEGLYRSLRPAAPEAGEANPQAVGYTTEQDDAASHTGSPALVDAGPGTGKTATLVRRVERILEIPGATPESVLALTFSNDAAEELAERLAARFGREIASKITVSTFHGFGVSFLDTHGHLVGLGVNFPILDEGSQRELVSPLLGSPETLPLVNLRDIEESVRAVVRHIGYLKDRLVSPDELEGHIAQELGPDVPPEYSAFVSLYRAYERAKAERKAVDFADLIGLPIRILREREDLVAAYRKKYAWVLVDEYQDVSRGVAELLKGLCGPSNPPWAVGDARQAIYRFRGAAPENVTEFERDFPSGTRFPLGANYRSSEDIIRCANRLAALMESAAEEVPADGGRWRAGANVESLGEPVVAVAPSDAAERAGIADVVAGWIAGGVPPASIAVLARRNVDVRNTALELGGRGVRSVTSGLVTSEGAAADLAAAASYVDRPLAQTPRFVYAVGRRRFGPVALNAAITHRLTWPPPAAPPTPEAQGILDAIDVVAARLTEERWTGDAFRMMCVFLFDAGDYLRRILDSDDDVERSLALDEVITSLARAAAYRLSHRGRRPHEMRLGFGEQFRGELNGSASVAAARRLSPDAVKVLTCHAAKGLEFDCVVVSGQTLAGRTAEYPLLPPSLRPAAGDDAAQADSLLFVGVTRARRALVVSYAATASGGDRAERRRVPPLLRRWVDAGWIETTEWPACQTVRPSVSMADIWGGALAQGKVAPNALAGGGCAIRTYLEQYLGLWLPVAMRPLYPIFVDAVRGILERIAHAADEAGAPLNAASVSAAVEGIWPKSMTEGHPHEGLYLAVARGYAAAFARAYSPKGDPGERLITAVDFDFADGDSIRVHLPLVAHSRSGDESRALMFRPESLAEKTAAKHPDQLLWSGLKKEHRLAFLLLRRDNSTIRAQVFSAADGRIYDFQWNDRYPNNMEKELCEALVGVESLSRRQFTATIDDYACDRCRVRTSCPFWMKAIE